MGAVKTDPGLTENAIKVLEKRYFAKDEAGRILETPQLMFRRVAKAVAAAESRHGKGDAEMRTIEDVFYHMMSSLEFLPNSPTLMNAGKSLGQLSACFVLPVGDSMEGIFDAVKYTALIHKSGGGTGFSFSRLRPVNDIVSSTKGVSSGPISFMGVFNEATETVKQGGTRRGANMGLLRVDHPDILSFITCKDDTSKFTNFNISVGITKKFMEALLADKEYELVNPRTKQVVEKLRAKDVFSKIINQAWKNGEPGIVFLDRMNDHNPTPHVGEIESTNPCGEQPLLPYESCNLGSINLALMTEQGTLDWERLKRVVRTSVRFLDDVIDVNKYPLDQIEEVTKRNRKIGLGVMGWADLLIQLGIPYNSEEAIKLGGEVMRFIDAEAKAASVELATERGTFPAYEGSIYDGKMALRNATVTTIAPTGTLSIIGSCSSGVEPLFAVSYVKNVLDGAKLVEVNPYFEKAAKERGFWSEDLMEKIAEKGTVQCFEIIPEDVRRLFVTAHDISPEHHIRMQAVFQKHVDNAVSKTVNLSHSATTDDVEAVYRLAYKLGCKGVTVYRDGTREGQVLSTAKAAERAAEAPKDENYYIEPVKLPISRHKESEAVELPGEGNYELDVTVMKQRPWEVWMRPPVEYGVIAELLELLARLMSIMLRSHISIKTILKQVHRAHRSYGNVASPLHNIEKALLRILGRIHYDEPYTEVIKDKCRECGTVLEYEGGCKVCRGCGMTVCG